MKEVKHPRKPLLYYYGIVMLVLILFNLIAMPWIAQRQIQEVDYGTFMTMTEEKNIGRVEIQSNQILFTDKEETTVYKTGLIADLDLVNRLHEAGAQFSGEIDADPAAEGKGAGGSLRGVPPEGRRGRDLRDPEY